MFLTQTCIFFLKAGLYFEFYYFNKIKFKKYLINKSNVASVSKAAVCIELFISNLQKAITLIDFSRHVCTQANMRRITLEYQLQIVRFYFQSIVQFYVVIKIVKPRNDKKSKIDEQVCSIFTKMNIIPCIFQRQIL